MENEDKILRELSVGGVLTDTPELGALTALYGLECVVEDGTRRLVQPLELLSPVLLNSGLSEQATELLSILDIHWTLDSTNTYLLSKSHQENFHGYACMAEQQTAGRGRRGRHWVSPFGKNIYLSLGWSLAEQQDLSGLSLAVGCCVTKAIASVSPDTKVLLKWPNDLLIDGGKTAGILVELASGPKAVKKVVVGVGINLQISAEDSLKIDQPWNSVSGVSRNQLASALISELSAGLKVFSESGFSSFVQDWNRLNAFSGKQVELISANNREAGICRGVDSSGHLLFEVGGLVREINAGELSLRSMEL